MLFKTLRYYWTLWEWRRRGHHRQRPHVSIGNVADFFRELNAHGVRYVVLRWFDCVPLDITAEARYAQLDGDLDLLVEAEDLLHVIRAVASHPGKVKADVYSNRLVLGTDVRRFTYYPPVLCRDLLKSRVLDDTGSYYRPDDRHYLYSLAYHLVYHKGLASGFPSGFPELPTQPKESDRHDAEGTLLSLAAAIGETLPEELTLLQLHLWLKPRGWNMPLDLLLRWPKQHPFLKRLYQYKREKLRQELGKTQNLCVYLLREDAIKAGATESILAEIATHYRILDTVTFTPEQQDRVIRRTRGGNWTKRKQLRLFLPEIAVVCQSLEAFQPQDDAAVAQDDQKRTNPDIRFKHAMREKLAAAFPEAADFVHGSDNDIESLEYIQAIYGDDGWQAKWAQFFPAQ